MTRAGPGRGASASIAAMCSKIGRPAECAQIGAIAEKGARRGACATKESCEKSQSQLARNIDHIEHSASEEIGYVP